MSVILRIDGSIVGAGVNNRSRSDISVGETVTLRSLGTGTIHTFRLLSRPSASASVLVAATATTKTIVPDVVGSYRIELIMDGLLVIHTFTVHTSRLHLSIPAFNEKAVMSANLAEIATHPEWIECSETNEGGTYVGYSKHLESDLLILDKALTNNAAEFNVETAKGTPVAADIVLIEDSADSWKKKKVALSTFPGVNNILDDSYNNDTGERTITVDAGDVHFDLTGTYSVGIDLSAATGAADGLEIENGSDYVRILRSDANKIALTVEVESLSLAAATAISVPVYSDREWFPACNLRPVGVDVGTDYSYDDYFLLGLDSDSEELVGISHKIPSKWDGANYNMRIVWAADPANAMADTETVKWTMEWRSRAVGETLNGGSVGTNTITYTQTGAGAAAQLYESSIAIAYNDANQPLTIADILSIRFFREETGDTYPHIAYLLGVYLEYNANKF